MSKKHIVLIASAFVVLTLSFLAFVLTGQKENQPCLKDRAYMLKNKTTALRLKIIEGPSQSFDLAEYQLTAKFYDIDGNLVKQLVQDYAGGDIIFDYDEVEILDKKICFPIRMNFDNKNLDLTHSYFVDDFPMIYNSKILDNDLKIAIKQLYYDLHNTKFDSIKFAQKYGQVTKKQVVVRPLPDEVYQMIISSSDGLKIISNQ